MKHTNIQPAISCRGLHKEFYIIDEHLNWKIVFRHKMPGNSFAVLKDINLDVPKGQFVGVLGRNGAGKSTLLRVLSGVYAPNKGVVVASGHISSLFEMGGLGNISLTGYGYASRFLTFHGINKSKQERFLNAIKDFSELGDDFDKPIYTYSSGMKARLYFSTATELQHEIYLVDELLSVGDEHFQAKSWKRLRERFSCGASGILVTHDWSAILKLCATACILEKGSIVAQGNAENMVHKYLRLPQPSKEYVEIKPQITGYHFESGQDCIIVFDVELKKLIPLVLSYSVELFRPGYGWELILLNDSFVQLDFKLGMNQVKIKIKQLPLAAGEYYLNIFLKSPDPDIDPIKLDTRSWTYGNGIKLSVEGESNGSMTDLPWMEKILVDEYAVM